MVNKISLFIVIVLAAAFAQPANFSGWHDTCSFTSFKKDSLKYGAKFSTSEMENKVLVWSANDTNSVGFSSDSVKFATMYRRGYVTMDLLGRCDTTYSGWCSGDTFNLTSAKIITPTTMVSSDTAYFTENRSPGMIDTSNVYGYAVMTSPIVPIWSPLIQVGIKGVAGNRVGGWVRVMCTVEQRQYVSVRNK